MKKIIFGRVACNVTLILYHKGYVEGTYMRHGQPYILTTWDGFGRKCRIIVPTYYLRYWHGFSQFGYEILVVSLAIEDLETKSIIFLAPLTSFNLL